MTFKFLCCTTWHQKKNSYCLSVEMETSFRKQGKMGHKVWRVVFGNSVPQNPSPLALLPRGRAFNFPKPHRLAAEAERASRAPRRAAFPCLSAGYYYTRRRSADPVPVKRSGGSDWLLPSFPSSHVAGKQPQLARMDSSFPPSSKRWCCSPINPKLIFVAVRPVAPFWSCVLRAELVIVWLLLFLLLLLLTVQGGLVATLGSLAT